MVRPYTRVTNHPNKKRANFFALVWRTLTFSQPSATLKYMEPSLIVITLALVSALESSNGRDFEHEPVRNLASIHFGDTAVGEFGMMPATMRLMKTPDPALAAHRYAEAALNHAGGCPLTAAVVLWEQGLNARSDDPRAWRRGNAPARLSKALALWKRRAFNPALARCFIIGWRYSGPYEFGRTRNAVNVTKTSPLAGGPIRAAVETSATWRPYRRGI